MIHARTQNKHTLARNDPRSLTTENERIHTKKQMNFHYNQTNRKTSKNKPNALGDASSSPAWSSAHKLATSNSTFPLVS